MPAPSTSATPSIYDAVTTRIVAALEAGTVPWNRPWRTAAPHNAATGRAYRGINAVLLGFVALEQGWESSGWLTYAQAQQLGAQVRRGERATAVVFWKPFERRSGVANDGAGIINGDPGDAPERFWLARTFPVFNAAQVDGLPAREAPPAPSDAADLSTWAALTGGYTVDVRHGGDAAFYSPAGDYVQLPPAGRVRLDGALPGRPRP
jgi:antirestriction protein ArdC